MRTIAHDEGSAAYESLESRAARVLRRDGLGWSSLAHGLCLNGMMLRKNFCLAMMLRKNFMVLRKNFVLGHDAP